MDGAAAQVFPSMLVLGLYTYKPNISIWGNVDTSNELDIEYANWGGGTNVVGFTTWPSKVYGDANAGNLEATDTGMPSVTAFPACALIRYRADAVHYALWSPSGGTCDMQFCFRDPVVGCKVATHKSSHRGRIPHQEMVPGINLWWHAGPAATPMSAKHDVTVVLTDFKYIPLHSPTPMQTALEATSMLTTTEFTAPLSHSTLQRSRHPTEPLLIPELGTLIVIFVAAAVFFIMRKKLRRLCRSFRKHSGRSMLAECVCL